MARKQAKHGKNTKGRNTELCENTQQPLSDTVYSRRKLEARAWRQRVMLFNDDTKEWVSVEEPTAPEKPRNPGIRVCKIRCTPLVRSDSVYYYEDKKYEADEN